MTITRMRERIKEAMTTRGIEFDYDNPDSKAVEITWPPPDDKVDRVVALFNEMLAEEKCGNGS